MKTPWFEEGLRFSCHQCGDCCTGEPGYVFLQKGEARAMAAFLGMGTTAFRKKYTRTVGGKTSLREEKDGRCVFFVAEGCRLYAGRPVQCRAFPFWLWIVSCRESWVEAARECPGMNQGRLYSREEIEEMIILRIGAAGRLDSRG